MTATALLAFAALLTAVSRRATRSWLHPLPAYFALWSLIALLLVLNPVHLVPVTHAVVVLILEGLGALFIGGWLAGLETLQPDQAHSLAGISSRRVVPVTAIALLVLIAGTYLVRGSIAAVAGQPYSNLTPTQIRALTVNSGASNAGLASIAYLTAPIVAALGILITKRTALGWLVVAAAIGVTGLTPDRTFTVTTAVIAFMFWLYSRTDQPARPRRVRMLVVAALFAIACVAYFLYEGGQLKQNSLITTQVPNAAIPAVLVPSVVYITAGPPSLSAALSEHLDPAFGAPWHSLWLLPRVAHLVDTSVVVPSTHASFVPIPFDFNTYTWIGDLYFDFGTLGVIIAGLVTGFVVSRVYRWAASHGTYEARFAAAVLATLLVFSVINYRFFWLECGVWLLGGTAALRLASPRTRIT